MMHTNLLQLALLALAVQGKRVLKESGSLQSDSHVKASGPKVHALMPMLLAFHLSPSNAFAVNGAPRGRASGVSTVNSGPMISRFAAPVMLDPSSSETGPGQTIKVPRRLLEDLIRGQFLTSEDGQFLTSEAAKEATELIAAEKAAEEAEPVEEAAEDAADAVAASAPRELVAFKELKASDFQHPQDKVNTQRLSLLYPIEFPLRQLLLPLVEEAGFLENIGRGVQVSALQAPTINRLAVEAAAQLDMPVPDVFIRQDPRPNAYTFAIQGKKPFIVLTSSLVDLMTLEEIKAVIGHELGHLKCEHSLWITILSILGLGIDVIEMVFPVGLRAALERSLVQWRRSAELSCDRASLLVAQDENVVMSVLMKLTGGSLRLAPELSPEEFALQAEQYEGAAKSSPLGRLILRQDESQLYPLPILRAREIQKYAKSTEYEKLKTDRASTIAFKSN